jgi:hypothetical protein
MINGARDNGARDKDCPICGNQVWRFFIIVGNVRNAGYPENRYARLFFIKRLKKNLPPAARGTKVLNIQFGSCT